MDWTQLWQVLVDIGFWREALVGSAALVWKVVSIVIPILVVLEVAKDLHWLDRISEFLAPAVKLFGISRHGALPLVVGMAVGIAYGAGMIIHAANEGKLTKRELQLIILFLVVNHAIVEDNFLFYRVGASFWALFLIRTLAAIGITWVASKFLKEREVTEQKS